MRYITKIENQFDHEFIQLLPNYFPKKLNGILVLTVLY